MFVSVRKCMSCTVSVGSVCAHAHLSIGSTDFQFFLIPPLAHWAEQTFTFQRDGKESVPLPDST